MSSEVSCGDTSGELPVSLIEISGKASLGNTSGETSLVNISGPSSLEDTSGETSIGDISGGSRDAAINGSNDVHNYAPRNEVAESIEPDSEPQGPPLATASGMTGAQAHRKKISKIFQPTAHNTLR
ncbi:hypothetical protein PHLCEN_2v10788 [Hermanssonia centrifuga]|uniref:Uncharacterized protein n=1 Tax=Hermanssonia centrifuga TaxID=98765 RepID=A0A2R6NLT9_9APHY|nr:hypothetical protein PHLCEN_2v10788 [Hermanssonia centrifuga]